MKLDIIDAQPWHARLALKDMRLRERKAFKRLGLNAEEFLIREINRSDVAKSGFYGNLLALWGIQRESIFDDKVFLWMIVTKAAENYPLLFARHSKRILTEYLACYGKIFTFVDTDFHLSIKWMNWLGFVGHPEGDFIRFEKWIQQP